MSHRQDSVLMSEDTPEPDKGGGSKSGFPLPGSPDDAPQPKQGVRAGDRDLPSGQQS